MNNATHHHHSESTLPLVVQVSFAGSRWLYDAEANPAINADEFHNAVRAYLQERLSHLRKDLKLSDQHFFCGLSQLAIGADTLFTQACAELNWHQRLLLPQQREDFLNATSNDGNTDFDGQSKPLARDLFNSPHIIQERVVSEVLDRHTRFQDVNLELLRLADVVVCLVNDAPDVRKSGGTHELIDEATRKKRPLLVIRVTVDDMGKAVCRTDAWQHLEQFKLPCLPSELADFDSGLTVEHSISEFCDAVKNYASAKAGKHQSWFKNAALIIIATHVIATMFAVAGMKLHGHAALPGLLAFELVLLLVGFGTHQFLHRSHATQVWAMLRLVAELARSVSALNAVPGYLNHLFYLPLPLCLRPLLRTLNVLHLRDTRSLPTPWRERCDRYLDYRFVAKKSGQIPYYQDRLSRAQRGHKLANQAFLTGSSLAILATLFELLEVFHVVSVHGLEGYLAPMAIILPVVAVAALSLAASSDLEGRVHTYREMLDFLEEQQNHLKNAASETAFRRLALETESRLLAETAGWYSRRAFTGVA